MHRSVNTSLVVAYPIVILATLLWSSTAVEKTLYDRYIIYNEGIILESDRIGPNSSFYSDVLDFPESILNPAKNSLGVSSFQLTERQHLHLAYSADPQSNPVIIIRVRNGFNSLHQELLKRLGKEAQQLETANALQKIAPGSVSTITKSSLGDQFVTSDLSGNKILFYQKRLRLF